MLGQQLDQKTKLPFQKSLGNTHKINSNCTKMSGFFACALVGLKFVGIALVAAAGSPIILVVGIVMGIAIVTGLKD